MVQLSHLEFFQRLYTIRRFEETVLAEFPKGIFSGTTHTYLGQEANAVGVLSNIEPGDIVFSNHRCHGHYLSYGGDARALFAEMMGKSTGVCRGIGGSQHLHYNNFFSNGILGGTIPIAVGCALAEKRKQSGSVTIAFMGDGALGEGIVYEAFNMASLWNAPILFVIENNHIAQTTPTVKALAGSIQARLLSFAIPCAELNTSDVLEIFTNAQNLLLEVRERCEPRGLILNTERFGPHSKGDDTRDQESINHLMATRDPIRIQANRLTEVELTQVTASVNLTITHALEQALNDPEE